VYGRAVEHIREAVKEGKSMAIPMEETGLFPPMTVQMVQVGEEVGELAKMTSRMASYYEERVETFISRMTRLFEPIAIVFMGGVVLVIVLSIFMPIFQMTNMKG
jgi:type IV pilus assembly protein PilC